MLGLAEMAAALGVALGVFAQVAALGLIVIMLGRHPEEAVRLAHRFLGDKAYR